MADACIKAYLKATSEAQSVTKQAIRDWKQNLEMPSTLAETDPETRGKLESPYSRALIAGLLAKV
jgi:hypothetical protein